MCVTASKYSTFSHFYHKVTNPSDSLEVKYYIWPADSAGARFNAVQAFSKVPEMMRVYAAIFGEYPFEKYGMAAVYPFFYGGMEHQTITTIHRSWLSVAGYPYNEDGIAHELAHQWWGDLVTCGTFKDIWLNESFATYAEALWHENEYGSASYDQKMKNILFFDGTWTHAIYDPEGQGQPLFGSAEYQKGAWVLHMLRYMLGDSMFFRTLENYRSGYEYSTATTSNFNFVVNSTAGKNYDWFFNEWIYGPGWPTYAYRVQWNDTTLMYDLQVRQLQTSYPFFKMPIEVKVSYQGIDSVYVLTDSLPYQEFPLQANIDSVKFDPRNRIIKQIGLWPTSVSDDRRKPRKLELRQNYPNPFNPVTNFEFRISNFEFVKLTVYNILGQGVATLVSGVLQPGSYEVKWDATNLPSGIYFYRLQTQKQTLTRKMILMR
jgi:aminopeptidase N